MGQLFYCCHLSSRSQRSPRWIEKSKAELLWKECGFPSYSPWQFDCSTWHIPSSGHSGLVDHGYRHILLGTVLIPVETQVSSVLLHQHSDPPPSSLSAAESNLCLSLSWGSSKRSQGEQDTAVACLSWKKARGGFLSLPVCKPEPRCCPFVLIVLFMIRETVEEGGEIGERG